MQGKVWEIEFESLFTKYGQNGSIQVSSKFSGQWSELDFHIWNANCPMKSEAKMAAHGSQFWTSVSVPYAGLYVSFSLPRHCLLFLKISLIENRHKTCLQKLEMSLKISNIFR